MCIPAYSEAFFDLKKKTVLHVNCVKEKRIHYLREDWIESSVNLDHRLSSLGKLGANR